MTKLLRRLISRFFDKRLELNVQVFNLLGFAGTAAGIIVAAISIAQNAGAVTVGFNLLASAVGVMLLCVTGKRISYRLAGWIVVAGVFQLIFPVLFFAVGGYRSGMPGFFILGIIFTALLLNRRERMAAIIAEFVIYIGCCLIAYYYPQTAPKFEKEIYYVSDVITGIAVAGSLLLMVVLLCIRMYYNRETQIKQLNRELAARNEALVKYDEMKSEFLAAVAHEISKPLTVIMGSSVDTMELLKETPFNMDEIRQNHKTIERKCMLIDSIVTDLMDTVAIESGRLSLYRQYVKLAELLQPACETGIKQLKAHNTRVIFELDDKLPPLWADPARIEQVMTNILSNAAQHTNDGTVTVKLTRTDNGQTVCVTDDGEGMAPDIAEAALQKNVTTRGDSWRHGYGLYICRQIIQAHGGQIWLNSAKGRGTSVYFTLAEGHDDRA